MPSKQAITVQDRASSPADIIFSPSRTDQNGVHHFVSSDGTPIGDQRLSFSSRTVGERIRLEVRLTKPQVVTETIDGVDRESLERVAYAKLSFDFDRRSNLQERKDVVGMIDTLIGTGQTEVLKVLQDLEDWY